jgi:4-hydroxy-3-methylbut-2-enyl diphosphate reductase
MKRVIISDNAGFCFGVKRAVKIALNTKGNKVNTLGPIIHNPQVVRLLEQKGITPVNELKEASDTLIIRAHGVPDSTIREAESLGLKVVDATCPLVKRVKTAAKELYDSGYSVLVVGEKSHPEVISIVKDVGLTVIEKPSDVDNLPHYKKAGVVSQTTQTRGNFNEITKRLKSRCDELKVVNTICDATTNRQNSAVELAKKVDFMVVIGGYNSSNTKNLAELCRRIITTRHIEDASELEKGWFEGKETVGITAGASTPDFVIKEVKEKTEEILNKNS